MRKVILIAAILLFMCQTAVPITLQRNNIFELTSLAYLVSFDTGKGPDLSKKKITSVELLGYNVIGDQDFKVAVEEHFKPFAGHEFVEYVRGLEKNEEGVALTTMFEVADALTVQDGEIVLNPGVDVDKVTDSECFRSKEELEKYVRLLNDFYKDTDFEDFVKENISYYEKCEARSNDIYGSVDNSYFESFILNGGKVNYIPVYSIYSGFFVTGDWKDGEMLVVISNPMYSGKGVSLEAEDLVKYLCSDYAGQVYDDNKSSIEKISEEVFDKFEAKGLNSADYRVNGKNGIVYDNHQQLTKKWMSWVYMFDYMNKKGMTEQENRYEQFATGLEHIYWLMPSLSKVLEGNSSSESLNHKMFAFYNDLADNFDTVVEEVL